MVDEIRLENLENGERYSSPALFNKTDAAQGESAGLPALLAGLRLYLQERGLSIALPKARLPAMQTGKEPLPLPKGSIYHRRSHVGKI